MMTQLDIALVETLTHLPHDYEKARTLLNQGANINAIDNYSEKYIRIYIHPILNSLEQVHLSVLIGALKSTLTIRSEEENPRKNAR